MQNLRCDNHNHNQKSEAENNNSVQGDKDESEDNLEFEWLHDLIRSHGDSVQMLNRSIHKARVSLVLSSSLAVEVLQRDVGNKNP